MGLKITPELLSSQITRHKNAIPRWLVKKVRALHPEEFPEVQVPRELNTHGMTGVWDHPGRLTYEKLGGPHGTTDLLVLEPYHVTGEDIITLIRFCAKYDVTAYVGQGGFWHKWTLMVIIAPRDAEITYSQSVEIHPNYIRALEPPE